ncbi:hypothetical protein ASPWEDRAFT_452786 [Aspergillus wentii DTO 134E9]|uniref:ubiquitinyl hydrolase 1 n=1 Tax=Aspergillus wentii DTO 134E9 TaxID=1073089 RepID=A0A1L9RRG5_ASPWE|nr:uncharacterized protein ASPWEDRAFT_452786 [Aspergillus wentii DTO 134E9]KAI9928103.1 hypothetical protein MW887_002136 [Aspergillus wentii]OJJ37417.1 hypothetical protein ASPWEDRAFT_452786 [Aspergillus wentii DTO 134E9]
MNVRRDRVDSILAQSPFHANNDHYDTVLQYLQNSPTLAYVFATSISAYFLLYYFGFTSFSLPQSIWNIIVYLTPSRIVVALDSKTTKLDSTDGNLRPMNFQAKSEAMQRIFGLDNTSFYSFFPNATTFSGFGNALLGSKDSLPPGLGNWDNSCYQNSTIQGFASFQSLATFLERNLNTLGSKGSLSTHEALRDIIQQLNSPSNYGQKLWIPPDLKSMSSWQQQDAQEYFSKVVDQIDHEVQRASLRQTRNLGLKMAGPGEHVIGSSATNGDSAPVQNDESSSFRNPLEGLLAQRVGCMKCGWTEGLSLIPFNCLTVPLGGQNEYDVRECLDQYMNLEPIEGVECAKCTLLRAQRQLQTLLSQIEEDKGLSSTPDSPTVSDAVRNSARERLQAVEEALEQDDFAESTLSKKCHIPAKNRATSTKSRQAVIARAPKCLVVHVNRSLFDEYTGMLRKNYAAVRFPKTLDLNEWCLGVTSMAESASEKWGMDPKESMLPPAGSMVDAAGRHYELRSVITHYGRHENGHYICYRKYSSETFPVHVPESVVEADGDKEKSERWYRLSDEDVQMVSESNVMSQGGAFMLFYEAIEPSSGGSEVDEVDFVDAGNEESASSFATPEDMSTTSVSDSLASNTSQATSVSASEKFRLPAEGQAVPV